jgi:hypothetical protein
MSKIKFNFKEIVNKKKEELGFFSLVNNSLCEKQEKKIAEFCYEEKEFELYLNKAFDLLKEKLKNKKEEDQIEYLYYNCLLDVLLSIAFRY